MNEQHIGRRIAHAMITIFVFQVFWKFGALIVRLLVFNRFGTAEEKHIFDAYMFAESTVVWTLYVAFDKFIFPTFLPLFSEERELRGEKEAWKFANSFGNVLALVLAGTVGVCIFWAPQVVDLIAPRWSAEHPETADTAVRFCRWMLPALFFVGLGSFTYALLNSHKRFAHAAAGLGMHRLVQAAIFAAAWWAFGVPALWAALAFVLSSPAKVITHCVGLRDKLRNYRLEIPYWRPMLRPAVRWAAELAAVEAAVLLVAHSYGRASGRLALLTAAVFFSVRGLVSWLVLRGRPEKTLLQKLYLLGYPVLMGVLVARLRDIVQDSYATGLEESGLFGAIKVAKGIGEMPTAIIPLALSMAMFPFLCDMFTKQDLGALREVVSRAVKMVVLFFLPLTLVVVILRVPLIDLLASKKVEPGLVRATALALALYSLAFIFYAGEMVLMQTFFSLQNTWLPTVVGAAASFGQVGFLVFAFRALEQPDSAAGEWLTGLGLTPFILVAGAYPLSRAFKNLALGSALHFKLKLFSLRDAVLFVPQVLLVSACAGAAAWGAWQVAQGLDTAPFKGAALTMVKTLRLGLPSAAAVAGFVGALLALKAAGRPVAEFEIIVRWLRETGWQKIKGKFRSGGG